MKKRSFDRQKKERSSDVNANFDEEKSGHGSGRNVVASAKLRDEMNNELLNQVCAVSNAGDERSAGNLYSTKGQSRTDGANQKRSHAERDERELPDTSGHGDYFGFLDPKGGNDEREAGRPEPGRQIHQALPPKRPKFFDRGQSDAEDERIEAGPGSVVDPGLKPAP